MHGPSSRCSGLAIAYSSHRKGRRTLVSQLFVPLLGDRVNGPIGKLIDVMAVFATLFGTTTSLGLGALQVNNGLASLFGVPVTNATQVVIIAAVTVIFTMSAVTGVNKGIKFLSQGSAVLAVALFVFILVVGPAVFIANLYVESLGTWATDFFRMSLQGTAFGGLEWMQWWTYFMLAWWVSWGAFVGVFLARISKGRTIRGFIMGVLVVPPSVVFFTWFTVFGGTAIHVDMFRGGNIAQRTSEDINSAFFATLEYFPFATVTSVVAILLVVMFFVSGGADANTFVLGMLTCDGTLTPRRSVLVLWGRPHRTHRRRPDVRRRAERAPEHGHRRVTALLGDHRGFDRGVLDGVGRRPSCGRGGVKRLQIQPCCVHTPYEGRRSCLTTTSAATEFARHGRRRGIAAK